jgi:general secretion pathway protein H
MSQAGNSGRRPSRGGEAGFTLFELMLVLTILVMVTVLVSSLYRSNVGSTGFQSSAQVLASRLRDLRAAAMIKGNERVATIDVNRGFVNFGDGRPPLTFDRNVKLAVTAAESEQRSPSVAGVRFYPNGSSSGGVISLQRQQQVYQVQVNWLTGRVVLTK